MKLFRRRHPPAIPENRYQTQETEMGRFVVDRETGEVIKELSPQKPEQNVPNKASDGMVNLVQKGFWTIVGTALGYLVMIVVFAAASFVLDLIAGVPILRYIIYWPSDAAWMRASLPPIGSVPAGASVAQKVCGSRKPMLIVVLVLYGLDTAAMLSGHVFQTNFLIRNIAIILTATVCISLTVKSTRVEKK